jgi:N-acetylglucosaminyl-diphospho-decaprenol L-rhamnosyltransferase
MSDRKGREECEDREEEGRVAEVGAVVVNYRSAEHSARCVESLKSEGVEHVVVVDNDPAMPCSEAVRSVMENVTVVTPGLNLGYGAAVNRGVAVLPGSVRLVLVCNPDLVFTQGSVKKLARAFGGKGSGNGVMDAPTIVGPMVLNSDGSVYPSARRFPDPISAGVHSLLGWLWPGNPFSRSYRMQDSEVTAHSRLSEVDWVSGACMMVRRDAFEALGGFDESYFMYVEDLDLCWRARRAGYKVAYEPAAQVVHLQGVSTASRPLAMVWHHHRSALIFAFRSMVGPRRALLPVALAVLALRAGPALARAALAGLFGPSSREAAGS